MTPRRGQSVSSSTTISSDPVASRLRPWLLGSVVALVVATPLLPTETVFYGGGLLLVMLLAWSLAVTWGLTEALSGSMCLRAAPTLLAWLGFLAWWGISLFARFADGNPRAGWNAFWLWSTMGVLFLLLRQLLATGGERRALVAVMIALAASLCTIGYYQYVREFPLTRKMYEQDPEKVLRDAGIQAAPGSAQRRMFEDRLRSTEPLATFALTNSFAAFLSPWLLVTLGILVVGRPPAAAWRSTAVLLGVLVVMLGCWWLTKSRAAWVATICGVGLLVVYGRRAGWRPDWRLAAGLAGLGTVAGVLAVFTGGLDRLVLLESSKSAAYRLQYWRATSALIRDNPWFGCGPGNFQQYYPQYKLPEASETIADPHNFVLEVWASAGTPAMLLLLAIFATAIWQGVWRRAVPKLEEGSASLSKPAGRNARSTGIPDELGSVRGIYWGALAGAAGGYFACGTLEGYFPSPILLVVGFPLAAVVLGTLHSWVIAGRLPIPVVVTALAVLVLNLLAAGGVSFASVATTLWVLLALLTSANAAGDTGSPGGSSTVDHLSPGEWRPARPVQGLIAVGLVLGMATYYLTTYRPILDSQTLVSSGNVALQMGNIERAREAYERAVAADPHSPDNWDCLVNLHHEMWLRSGSAADQQSFRRALEESLDRQRHTSHAHTLAGHLWLAAYRRFQSQEMLREAIAQYQVAVSLYPNYNLGHAQLAWALHLAGDPRATAERREAERLNALNPHREQQLSNQQLYDPQPAGLGESAPPNGSAEQWLGRIRS